MGGDWYDTFRIAPDVLALSVGDVVGRGLAAATAMGQLRTAARASADPDLGPERVVERLDRFVDRTGTGFMASVVHAQLDLAADLQRRGQEHVERGLDGAAGGEATFLWHARSTPLGIGGPTPRVADTVRLAPGDLVVLYTDGVVERRDRSLAGGLDELAEVVTNALGAGLTGEEVLAALVAQAPAHDDACLLAVRWLGVGQEAERTSAGEVRPG